MDCLGTIEPCLGPGLAILLSQRMAARHLVEVLSVKTEEYDTFKGPISLK